MKASRGAISRLSRPSPIMLPQLDAGGGTPSPRKLSAPSTTMVTATPSRKKASSGRNTFGSSSYSRMRACEAPSARAAMTNSRSARLRVAARATRMNAIQQTAIQNKLPSRRVRLTGLTIAVSMPISSTAMADPRIEHGIEHVDDEIHQHEAAGHEQHDTLQDDQVAGVDCADQESAE